MVDLYYLLLFLLNFLVILIFLSFNPIHSVLFLIFSFCIAAVILFLLNAEFIGLLFIMIYVGAVAILFLFVIMMIETKIHYNINYTFEKFIYTTFFIIFFYCFLKVFSIEIYDDDIFSYSLDMPNFLEFFDKFSNLVILGQSLYIYFFPIIIIAGLILLVALIGSIVLTINLNKNSAVINKDLRQLSRKNNVLKYYF